jgi:hypothetical protein
MLTTTTDELLRRRAEAVTRSSFQLTERLTALQAARSILGIVSITSEVYGTARTRDACGALANHEPAWSSKFRDLPRDINAQVLEPERLLAHACLGLLYTAGPDNLRAALSFWAVVRDAAVLQKVAAGASLS